MTPQEAAIVRDLRARLRMAQDEIRRLESTNRDIRERTRRRIARLETDKKIALTRARKATDSARYWQGVCIAKGRAAA